MHIRWQQYTQDNYNNKTNTRQPQQDNYNTRQPQQDNYNTRQPQHKATTTQDNYNICTTFDRLCQYGWYILLCLRVADVTDTGCCHMENESFLNDL